MESLKRRIFVEYDVDSEEQRLLTVAVSVHGSWFWTDCSMKELGLNAYVSCGYGQEQQARRTESELNQSVPRGLPAK